jgi:hypothetical protein
MVTVEELRNQLVELGLSQEEASNIKGKQNLYDKITELRSNPSFVVDEEPVSDASLNESFDDIVLDETEDSSVEMETADNKVEFDEAPRYGSVDWHDYVMTQFQEDELHDGRPNAMGLRRLVENLLGPIVDSGPTNISSSLDPNSNGRAYCQYQVVIAPWRLTSNDLYDGSAGQRVFRGAADAFDGNVSGQAFARFPVAMAETRAEVRALKRALQLKVVAAEEMADVSIVESMDDGAEWDGNNKISEVQIKFIITKCKQMNIDLMKFINSGQKQDHATIEEVDRHTAVQMIARINQYQNNSDINVPKELKLKLENEE